MPASRKDLVPRSLWVRPDRLGAVSVIEVLPSAGVVVVERVGSLGGHQTWSIEGFLSAWVPADPRKS